MRLLSLNIENFRNIVSATISFSGDRIFLLGPNGQGKTNLLEAIGMAGTLRSFRKSGMEGLVREGEPLSQNFYRFLEEFLQNSYRCFAEVLQNSCRKPTDFLQNSCRIPIEFL